MLMKVRLSCKFSLPHLMFLLYGKHNFLTAPLHDKKFSKESSKSEFKFNISIHQMRVPRY